MIPKVTDSGLVANLLTVIYYRAIVLIRSLCSARWVRGEMVKRLSASLPIRQGPSVDNCHAYMAVNEVQLIASAYQFATFPHALS